ncbi:MAG: response regulator, partial [Gammaproteobacteria bacterium]|nr:response regulator [Gammaproteobacteria bacterium]
GQEAVDLVKNNSFDAVIMDMQMPVMDGIEATKVIRASGNSLPIIALTANVMQKHRDAFNEAGCNCFLGKPINKNELLAVLKGCVNRG